MSSMIISYTIIQHAVSQIASYSYLKKELMPSVAFQMIKNRQKRMLHELQSVQQFTVGLTNFEDK